MVRMRKTQTKQAIKTHFVSVSARSCASRCDSSDVNFVAGRMSRTTFSAHWHNVAISSSSSFSESEVRLNWGVHLKSIKNSKIILRIFHSPLKYAELRLRVFVDFTDHDHIRETQRHLLMALRLHHLQCIDELQHDERNFTTLNVIAETKFALLLLLCLLW